MTLHFGQNIFNLGKFSSNAHWIKNVRAAQNVNDTARNGNLIRFNLKFNLLDGIESYMQQI